MGLPLRDELDLEAGQLLHQGERGGVRDALAGLVETFVGHVMWGLLNECSAKDSRLTCSELS